jgi:hypothetical protein
MRKVVEKLATTVDTWLQAGERFAYLLFDYLHAIGNTVYGDLNKVHTTAYDIAGRISAIPV